MAKENLKLFGQPKLRKMEDLYGDLIHKQIKLM